MSVNLTKLIEVVAPGALHPTRETVVDHSANNNAPLHEGAALNPYPRDLYGNPTIDPLKVDIKAARLREAAVGRMSTPNFPDLLRAGVRFDVFSGFNERPLAYPMLVRQISSNRPFEEYADDVGFGIAPIVKEGEAYPLVSPSIGGGLKIPNYKRGYIVEVTEELMKFDLWGKVRDLSTQIGRSLRLTREQAVLTALTNVNNYNSAKNLNDGVGGGTSVSNQQTLTFTPQNLNKAMAIITTQKDRNSGQYIGAVPDTMVVTPLLERFARMLISSPELMRVGGNGTNEQFGNGTRNPFFGIITKVVVSPMFGNQFEWALLDSTRALYFQEVEGLSVQNEGTTMTSESWLTRDTVRYKARDWYGVGMRDDRFAFYSNSTTPPVAD